MPHKGQSPQSFAGNSSTSTEPYYSNEDISVLHEIVELAQEILPHEPLATNALFSAYYTVLARFQVNPDHDNRYARILFKIGGLRGPGSLYAKFEELLSRMGIKIEFAQNDEDKKPITLEDSDHNPAVLSTESSTPKRGERDRNHQRRNSESSAYDIGFQARTNTPKRRNSVLSAPGDTTKNANAHENLDDHLQAQGTQSLNTSCQDHERILLSQSIGTWLASGAVKMPVRRDSSVSNHQSFRIRRGSISPPFVQQAVGVSLPTSDDYEPASETTAATSRFDEGLSLNSIRPLPPYQRKLEPQGLTDMKVSLILDHHLGLLVKQCLQTWSARAQGRHDEHIGLDITAAAHDRNVLMHSALDTWRLRLLETSQAAATENFFSHLETRATRARHLYLLHVAFTHWSTCASEQVQRTAVARRHVIRNRIFNAWREITAVNELKVRRNVFRKFFRMWKQTHQNITSASAAAAEQYVCNLTKISYQAWLHKSRATKAFNWWAQNTKRHSVLRWITVSHQCWTSQHDAEVSRQDQLGGNTLRVWKRTTTALLARRQDAHRIYCDNLRRRTLRQWCFESGVIPAKHTMEREIAVRQLRVAFLIWLCRTRQEQQAAALDSGKILREAWTNWRHKARSHLISARLDSRVVMQGIYKFILVGRTTAMGQVKAKARLHKAMQIWMLKSRGFREFRWTQEAIAEAALTRKIQYHSLRHWYLKMESRQQLELIGLDYSVSHVLRRVLLYWVAEVQQMKKLKQWSVDAGFYFLASRTIQKWHSFTESAKREKRKAAYGEVRRTSKMRLVRSIFSSWQVQVHDRLHMKSKASDIRHKRNVNTGLALFSRWCDHAMKVIELERIGRNHVAGKHLNSWKNYFLTLQALQAEAVVSYETGRESRSLKRWSLVTLQLRAQENYAADIREKNSKRTFRRILTYWYHKTALRRPFMPATDIEPESTSKVVVWSNPPEEFGVDDWAKGSVHHRFSTLVPGYLNTPSKRLERVMAVTAKYSTTPKGPLSTPLERQLRAQLSSGLPSIRGLGLKSTLGREKFTDIPGGKVNQDSDGLKR